MCKRIGVTMRVERSSRHHEMRDAVAQDWSACLESCLPEVAWLPIPNLGSKVEGFLGAWKIESVILTGGNNVGGCPVRDETEERILTFCTRRNLPVLGVCRGLHMLQVFHGGNLRPVPSEHQSRRRHPVRVRETRAAALFDTSTIEVNSYHTQGVSEDGLAEPLQAWLLSDDGFVEGLVHRSLPQMAVQWHPERPLPDPDDARRLLRFFAFQL